MGRTNDRPASGSTGGSGPPRLVVLVCLVAAAAWVLRSPNFIFPRRSGTETRQVSTHLFASMNPAFSLRRSAAAILLEYNISGEPTAGLCHEQRCLLPDTPDRVCQNLRCMWSDAAGANVDLWLQPLRELPGSEFSCPRPAGGQAAQQVPNRRPVVSFVVTMHNSAAVTAQCLLELFRTAHEVESAEFIVVDDGSTEDVGIVHEARVVRLCKAANVRTPTPSSFRILGADYGAPAAPIWREMRADPERPVSGLRPCQHAGHPGSPWRVCCAHQQ